MRHAHILRSGLLALALAAGTTLPAMADTHAQPKLTVSATKSGGSLSLNGKVFHSTASRIAHQRVLTWASSPRVVIVWEEFNGGAKTSRYAISNDGQTVDQVATTENKIRLRYSEFDPLAGEPAIPAQLRADANNELYLVQFVATPIDEMRRDVAARGGTIEAFLPDNTQVVRMNAAAVAEVAALPHVRWVGIAHPAYRVSTEVRDTLLSAESAAERYSMECWRRGPSQQQAVAAAVQAQGGLVEGLTPDQFRMEATLTPAQLLQIIRRNEIAFVDPWGGPGGTDMDIARQIGGAVPIISGIGMTGQGVRGEVHDTEVFDTHTQWAGQVPLHHGANGNSGTHGSSCYGINFATGTGDASATGMLPNREQGIFFWYTRSSQFTAGQPSRLSWNIEATDPAGLYRSCYQTSSVGGGVPAQRVIAEPHR